MSPKTLVLTLILAAFASSTQIKKNGDLDWWKHASIYQIYPRSFKDSDNDGIGDLQGIIQKLDLFPETDVDAIWLSPIFQSPQVDQGYDISDYRVVDPVYGTNDDLAQLIEEAHAKGVKIILDFVPNHTSDKHQWFIDSVKGVEEYRDYYVWANAKLDDEGNRLPPNNWISAFKNSAWTWNDERQQYYLHEFAAEQPDLNYRNPDVVEAMKDVLRFWLDNGVDGFRVDAIPLLFESMELPDEPLSDAPGYDSNDYQYLNHIFTTNLPETYDMVYQWRQLVDDYVTENGGDARILMTEVMTDTAHTMLYFGNADGSIPGAHFPFNFNLITDINVDSTAQDIVDSVNRWLDAIPKVYTSNWVIGNHDQHRAATRFGPANVDGFNLLKSVLPGVAVTYNGEEIGQENGEVAFEEGQDPSARDPAIFESVTRDFERTPYQWDESVNAGFNEGAKPWLPVSEKYLETNLKDEQESDGNSHFKVYQAVAALRADPVLVSGDVQIAALSDYVVWVKRSYNDASIALIFNKGDEEATVEVDIPAENNIRIASIDSARELGSAIDPSNLVLAAHEALVVSYQN